MGGCPTIVALVDSETEKSTSLSVAMSQLNHLCLYFEGCSSSLYERGTQSFFIQRSAESTLLFAMDDPHSFGKINDLVVVFFVGSESPQQRKSLLCLSDYKNGSHAFQQTTVAPVSEKDIASFEELEELVASDGDEPSQLSQKLIKATGRSAQNWAKVLLFLKLLLHASDRTEIFKGIVATVNSHLSPPSCASSPDPSTIISQSLEEIVQIATGHTKHKVWTYLRSDLHHGGSPVLSVVLTDTGGTEDTADTRVIRDTSPGRLDSIVSFGPTQCHNTERFQSFNSHNRAQNIYGNRQSPSWDIATKFTVIYNLRYICSGEYFNG
uniref:Uncharacterized protein n=1 Tax=Amphimedon queenslandica TaxID=400682 RepID=A0A1X7U455_AMPQE